MNHSQAYLSYQRGIHLKREQGIATPAERARYNPALAAKAMGKAQPK